jgi:hypothetical protein
VVHTWHFFMIADRLKRPLKRPDRVCPLGKNQEYACHYDWKIDRASSVPVLPSGPSFPSFLHPRFAKPPANVTQLTLTDRLTR